MKSINFSKAAHIYDTTRIIPYMILVNAIASLENDQYIKKGLKCLDIGCGTGQLTKVFAENGYSCTGIDVSEDMLRIAKQKGVDNAAFLIGDARNISFKDKSFDICISSKLFLHIENWPVAVNEILRVLKETGCFIYMNEIGFFSNDVRKYFRKLADQNGYTNRFLGEYDLEKIISHFVDLGCNHKRYQSPRLSWNRQITYDIAFKEIKMKSFAEFWMIPDDIYEKMLMMVSEWIEKQDGGWKTVQKMKPQLIVDIFSK